MMWLLQLKAVFILYGINKLILLLYRFPLKAVKVMHTVSLRTEATITGGAMPPNLGQAFKVTQQRPHVFCYTAWGLLLHFALFFSSFILIVNHELTASFMFSVEPHERDVCIPCDHDVQHAWNFHCCLHQNWFYGYITEPLSAFWHYICLHK